MGGTVTVGSETSYTEYTQLYSYTDDETKALKLMWDDRDLTYPAPGARYFDEYLGDWVTPATNVTFTEYGVKRAFPTLEQFATAYKLTNVFTGADGVLYYYPSSSFLPTNTVVLPSTGGTRILTTREVEGFKLTLSVPGLYYVDRTNGYTTTSVSVSVFYRAYDPINPPTASTPWSLLVHDYTISAKQRAEILKTVSTGNTKLPLSIYEVLVVRNTTDHSGSLDYVDNIYIKELTEIVFGSIAYNHTALLGLKIRATDQLSGQIPTVTSLVKGIKVKVPSNLLSGYKTRYSENTGTYDPEDVIKNAYISGWDGTLADETVWTDNPVWCLYDLITNTRYGLGDYYKISPDKAGLMLANFYLMSRYCDEAIEYRDEGGALKKRPRFAMNMVIDQAKSAADWIAQIAAIMRATVYYTEGVFWLDIDRPKNISQLFTMSSITEYTQSGISFRTMPNCYEVQWINPATNYEVDVFKVESAELQVSPHLEERKKALQLIGVTNFDQAKSLAKYALLSGTRKNKIISFKTGASGLLCMVGDIIGVQHDVPRTSFGGVIKAYDAATGIAEFDPPILLTDEADYTLKIDMQGQDIRSVDMGHLLPTTLAYHNIGAGLDFKTDLSYQFIVDKVTNEIAQYKITAIKRDTDELLEITAVTHDQSLFAECDSTEDVATYTINSYKLVENPSRISVQGVTAQTKVYQDTLGVWKTGVEIFYAVPTGSSFWRGAQIHYAIAGSGVFTSLAEVNLNGHVMIPHLPEGEYQIIITSIYSNGKQTISDALSDTARHPWTYITVNNFSPNDLFMQGVTGLKIQGGTDNGVFYEKDCTVEWNHPVPIDATAALVAEDDSAGANTKYATNWFNYYEVEVWSADGTVRRRTEQIWSGRQYTYTYEKNQQDGASRAFKITIYAYDKLGRKSAGKSIICSNPAPAATWEVC